MTLSSKLAAAVVGATLTALLLPGYLLWRAVDEEVRALEVREAAELAETLSTFEAELIRSTVARVRRLAAELERDAQLLSAALGDGRPGAALEQWAARVMVPAGLDALELLAADGTVLSHGHWPARIGQQAELPAPSPPSGIERVMARSGNRSWASVEHRVAVEVGRRRLVLSGGRSVERALRETPPPAAATLGWLGPSGRPEVVVPATSTLPELMSSYRRFADEEPPWGGTVPGRSGRVLQVQGVSWRDGSGPIGALVAVRDVQDLRDRRMAFLRAFGAAAAAALAVALVLGGWLARRFSRPVRELTEATGRVAAGRDDPFVPVRSTDELGQLTESFNAMSRAIRRSRKELARTSRLAAWRDAARRVAHEVKNPLAPIRMSVDNLRRAREVAPEHFDEILAAECRTIVEEVDALRRLVDEFSRFARLPRPSLQPTDLEGLLRRVRELFQGAFERVEIRCEIDPDLPSVPSDPDLLGQVVKNLVLNAGQALEGRAGTVVIGSSVRGRGVEIWVTDDGPGIPDDVRERLFEPRVTTKEGGSGLGLAISRDIVEQHGGRIEVDTGPSGSTFRVWLPGAP